MSRSVNPQSMRAGAGALAVLGIAGGAAYTLAKSLFDVNGGHRAVIFNLFTGVDQEVKGEGTHIIIPFVEVPVLFDVRTKPHLVQSLTGSKDLQMVNITLRVLSKPSIPDLPTIYTTLGTDYDERVLPSIVNEVSKSVVAQFTASQLITQRAEVSQRIFQRLRDRAKDFNILLDDVSITHLAFGKEYTSAVEAKQVAQQEAERAKFVVDKAIQDKRQIIIKAEGEAKSAKLIGDAMKDNPAFLSLRRIEAARDIAHTIATSNNKVFLNSDSLLINLNNLKEGK